MTRRWRRPAVPRPPFGPPERVRELGAAPATGDFLTGNGFAARCRHVLNYDVLHVDEGITNDWWFCKADYLEHFFARIAPRRPYVLFSHNSDRAIDERFLPRLDDRRLVAWLAQNPAVAHPKLLGLPIGVANPVWPHGDQAVLRQARDDLPAKTALFDVAFDLATNREEREACLAATGLEPAPRVPFPEYLRRLAGAYFCLSPRGNGIDVHRTWEALYLRTIPVVTRSILTDQHPDLPWIVLDDWSSFDAVDFSPALYHERWGDFDPASLRLDAYLARVETAIGRLRARAVS